MKITSHSYLIDPAQAMQQARADDDALFLKYINTDDGYFFCGHDANHKQLFANSGAAYVYSAGFIAVILGEYTKIGEEWSSTLKKGPFYAKDIPAFEKLFGVKCEAPEWFVK